MRKGFRVGLTVFLVALCVGVVSATALGATISKTVDVVFKGITIMVNGRQVQTDAEPLVYQDRTYAPIRAVAEALGADVSWDPEKNQVVINGRLIVRADPAPPVKECYTAFYCFNNYKGLIINDSGKTVKQLTVTCKAYDQNGKLMDQGTWPLEKPVYPGASTFKVKSDANPEVTPESPSATRSECEIVHTVYD